MWLYMNLQERASVEEFLKNVKSKEFRDFCTSLLSNHIGGPRSNLCINPNLSAQRQTLLELLVHLNSVLFSGNTLLLPLHQIAVQPQNVIVRLVVSYLLLFFHGSKDLAGRFSEVHNPYSLVQALIISGTISLEAIFFRKLQLGCHVLHCSFLNLSPNFMEGQC